MIVLDTNIISELGKASPDPNVARWASGLDPAALRLCAPVVAELAFGADRKRLRDGNAKFQAVLHRLVEVDFSGRILPFGAETALLCGQFRAKREALGRTATLADMMIAAICRFHGAALATRNVKDFEGLELKLVNPFEN